MMHDANYFFNKNGFYTSNMHIHIFMYIVLVMTQSIQKTFLFLVHSLRALGSMEMRLHYGRDYTKNIKRPEIYWLTLDQTKHLVMIRLAEATTQYSLTLRKQIRQADTILFVSNNIKSL